MTIRVVQETAATADDGTEIYADRETSTLRDGYGPWTRVTRSGVLVAIFAVSAGLTTGTFFSSAPIWNLFANYTGRRRWEAMSDSGTTVMECDPELAEQIQILFAHGASEFFHDGMQSDFSRRLRAILVQYRRAAFQVFSEVMISSESNPDVISEALRWLSDFNDPSIIDQRWSILQRTLRNQSSRVRDGAILGFASLDDPRARPLLQAARSVEDVAELRELIDKVIGQLDATAHDTAAAHRQTESLV